MGVSEHLVYNLAGFGNMRVRLFPHARRVWDFVEQHGHISRLRHIDQLGVIRDVLPGAHHTRYEYLMAQLALITELCNLSSTLPTGIGLTCDRNTFGRLPGATKDPSNGEVLMVLAILSNIGHLPGTFSAERAYLKYLRDSSGPRKSFRLGLEVVDRPYFDHVVEAFDVYRLNYCIALFMLNRYRRARSGPESVDFCQSIIRSFTSIEECRDEGLAQLWGLYKSIRRLTYMSLDSHYAPVPFSLDLPSIFFSLKDYLVDIFTDDSGFQDALARLEGVMQDTVYLAPLPLLNHARVSDSILTSLEHRDPPVTRIRQHWDLLDPLSETTDLSVPGDSGAITQQPGAMASLCYQLTPELVAKVMADPLEWERQARKTVGLRSCAFGAEFDPRKTQLHIVAALRPGFSRALQWKAVLRICKQLVDHDIATTSSIGVSQVSESKNGISVARMLLRGAFGDDIDSRLVFRPVVRRSPVMWGYGSTSVAKEVDAYFTQAEATSLFHADELNEFRMLRDALRHISYRGCLVAFAGATVLSRAGSNLVEFDGIAFLLSRETDVPTVVIVEAKNMTGGHTAARRDLQDKFMRLGIDTQKYSIEDLGHKGAYASVVIP